jgi:heme exporter protein B
MVAVYDVTVRGLLLATVAAVAATAGIAAAGTLYGAFVGLDHSRDSLLAILLLPVLVPVLLGGTQVLESATSGSGDGDLAWLGLLTVFAALYAGMGVLSFASIFEEA